MGTTYLSEETTNTEKRAKGNTTLESGRNLLLHRHRLDGHSTEKTHGHTNGESHDKAHRTALKLLRSLWKIKTKQIITMRILVRQNRIETIET